MAIVSTYEGGLKQRNSSYHPVKDTGLLSHLVNDSISKSLCVQSLASFCTVWYLYIPLYMHKFVSKMLAKDELSLVK